MNRSTCAILIDYYGGDYQLGLIRGAEDAAIRLDDHLVVAVGRWLNAPSIVDATQNDIFRHLRTPVTQGVAVAAGCLSHYVSAEQLAAFCHGFAPMPVVSVSVDVPAVPSLVVDNRRGQKLVVEHLVVSHGCRRIAYIRGPATSLEAEARLDGYRAALKQYDIPFDPELVLEGNFWVDSGGDGAKTLLARGAHFDGLATANDNMAFGAMDALKAAGVRVPEDVPVVGFDDVPLARITAPSLTTVRQPLLTMGHAAIQLLHDQMDGKPIERLRTFDLELVRRQSCGCGYRTDASIHPRSGTNVLPMTLAELGGLRPHLQQTVLRALYVRHDDWPRCVDELLLALEREASGERGCFLSTLTAELERTKTRPEILDQFYCVVAALRGSMRYRSFEGFGPCAQEDLWHSAVLLVGEWISRAQMRLVLDQERSHDNLRASIERLSTALTHATLAEALEAIIPTTAIPASCLGLYPAADSRELRALVVTGSHRATELKGQRYLPAELAPQGFLPSDRRATYILTPLSHGDKLYGQALFEAGEHRAIYSMLREQIGAALKAADLHRSVIEETSRRERAERAGLERETEIAQRIQTAILPKQYDVAGLEIAAIMQPASDVGGDYYDVIPTDDGCMLGIGDVTGHGLLAGMIMLMVQSMIAAVVRANPLLPPSQLLPSVNHALYDNVRHRLKETDHVTLTLIQYQRDGRLKAAGAHEDILIYRQRSGKCEAKTPPGFWLGAIPDVTEMTTDAEIQLEDGDVLVLFTDGVTESMNEAREQFGLERLMAQIERHGREPLSRLCDSILQAVRFWSSARADDVSLLVARYRAPPPTA